MSCAFSATPYTYFFGTRLGLLYSMAITEVMFPPGGKEELDALVDQMWHQLYPYEVVAQCRKQ
jgi:hypothetical protein